MNTQKKIKSALISVYHKDHLDEIIHLLDSQGVQLISTGGTAGFIEELGCKVTRVEELTGYPSILGGRVKTLHPMVFGGILGRRDLDSDQEHMTEYSIPAIDLVVVDLYPFEETLAAGGTYSEVVEKIDIGGISLIRAAAKNHLDVVIVPSKESYPELLSILKDQNGETSLDQRKKLAGKAFSVSSHYDTSIWRFFAEDTAPELKISLPEFKKMRYGENPHQTGRFYGDLEKLFDQLHGKEISYNNLLDIDAAIRLIDEFKETTFAILKHNNACGIASRDKLTEAWKAALAGDPVSAFGGILVTNSEVDEETAAEIDQLFFEVIIAPGYREEALRILKKKKNRIILNMKSADLPDEQFRTLLNGVLWQERDTKTEIAENLKLVTKVETNKEEISDLLFANILVKHTKSNAIVLAKNKQLISSGTGQTSRVDALMQSIDKANHFGHNLEGAVMASDAFFPFKDSVAIAHKAGIGAVIQPGGSIRDQESIDYCDEKGMKMVFTGTRHFKH
ncbi:MAG: bifunctional phosphoribosylaminoimidazolecarboxamide formyltransferase/IMP cyclohydrolase [Bacteroidales bacterium]|nr:bifunctional phosphoribosylaminoimidazolecarboxamide formyltransferase/IMP cyclohydrolase [Bacteroidales bacterium]